MKVHLHKCKTIIDKNGKQWITDGVIGSDKDVDIVEVGPKGSDCEYYEVLGYSHKRKAYWVEKIDFDTLTDSLEQELEDYVERMGHS